MNRRNLAMLTVLGISLWCADLQAEVFMLTHGGRIEGEWLNRGEAKPEMYEIEMLTGGRITVPASLVEEVLVKSEAVQRYEELLPKVPNTIEGHLEMAERCRKAGLKTQRDFHLRKVLELDPNHAEARHGLGFSQIDGEWVKADEWLKNQGFVRYKGGWRLAQEVEIEARNERQVIEEKEWRKRLKVWRSSIVRGRNDAAEALAQLQAIDSSLAIAGLSELLSDPDESNQLKLLYIDVLAKFNSSDGRRRPARTRHERSRSGDSRAEHRRDQEAREPAGGGRVEPSSQRQEQRGGESGGLGAWPARGPVGRSGADRGRRDETSFQGADRQWVGWDQR